MGLLWCLPACSIRQIIESDPMPKVVFQSFNAMFYPLIGQNIHISRSEAVGGMSACYVCGARWKSQPMICYQSYMYTEISSDGSDLLPPVTSACIFLYE